jgi:restriction system protein
MTSDEAFEFLRQKANQELKIVQEQGAAYLNQGNLPEARRALDRAEQIKAMMTALQELKERWKSLVLPLVVVPSSEPAVRRRKSYDRLAPGQKTPQVEFYIPVLQALVELGGSDKTGRVMDRVGEIMGDRLNVYDRAPLLVAHAIRWRDTISWIRSDLEENGYLSANSPHGIWEITPAGRAFLEDNQRKKIETEEESALTDIETIRIGDVLISHKGKYHHIVESITGNVARILWLERQSGEPQEFYTYHRDVNINVAPRYYDVIPAEHVDRAQYQTPKGGWAG